VECAAPGYDRLVVERSSGTGPRGLNHVEVYVSDLARTVVFWGWLLTEIGFEPFQEWDDGRSWRCGDSYIVFVQASEPYRSRDFHRKRPGLNHIALWSGTGDRLLDLTQQLRQRGVRILYEDRPEGEIGAPSRATVWFEDPDRIKVELVATDAE